MRVRNRTEDHNVKGDKGVQTLRRFAPDLKKSPVSSDEGFTTVLVLRPDSPMERVLGVYSSPSTSHGPAGVAEAPAVEQDE